MLFLQRIENWAKRQDGELWIKITLGASLIMRVIFLIEPSRPWWDATVYQGMGRYIASGELYGAWEFFRPPFWPLVQSLFAWTGPHAMEWIAKIITVLVSLAAIYCVYLFAKPIDKRAGMLAATLLSLSVPFLSFSTIPMTEVLSTFFVIGSAVLFVRGKWFWAGLIAGIAFITRFPTGLIMPAFAITVLLTTSFSEGFYKYVQTIFLRGLLILSGFLVLAIPYFVSNYLLYGSVTNPLVAGTGMITGFLWLYQGGGMFYVITMLKQNPASILLIAGVIIGMLKWKHFNEEKKRLFVVSIAAIVLFLGYFSLQAHKEFRYIMPAFPFVFALSGMGFAWISSKWNKRVHVITALAIVLIAFIVSLAYRNDIPTSKEGHEYRTFYSALSSVPRGTPVVSSTPAVAAFSPITLIEGYNTWALMRDSYGAHPEAKYVTIDSCELHACEPGNEIACEEDKERVLAELSQKGELVYDTTVNLCQLKIFKLHTSQ